MDPAKSRAVSAVGYGNQSRLRDQAGTHRLSSRSKPSAQLDTRHQCRRQIRDPLTATAGRSTGVQAVEMRCPDIPMHSPASQATDCPLALTIHRHRIKPTRSDVWDSGAVRTIARAAALKIGRQVRYTLLTNPLMGSLDGTRSLVSAACLALRKGTGLTVSLSDKREGMRKCRSQKAARQPQ